MPENFADAPTEILTKEEVEAKAKLQVEEEKKLVEADAAAAEEDKEEVKEEEIDWSKLNKREKTAMKKKIANRKKSENNKQKNQKANDEKNPPQKSKKQIARELKQEFDYNMCDFPISYKDKSAAKNWFEFNDSTVTPIMPGTLQKGFGGNSTSAYMLVYRQRKLLK